ncbi:MAG: hypothetical protein AB1483_09170 [Candidatus Zixiibacteriota bacterium]
MRLPQYILLIILLGSMVVLAQPNNPEPDYALYFDMPEEKMMARWGRLAGTKLTAEDLELMAEYQFLGDTLKLLVIPVEWIDRLSTWPRETLDSMIFSRDVYPNGSLADYIYEVSYGKVVLDGDVIDWYNAGYYDVKFAFAELLEEVDPFVDFSQYDGDGNRKVDAICFLRSGNGEEDSQDPNDIWSYATVSEWGFGSFDNVKVDHFHTCPETRPLRDPLDPRQFSGEDTLNGIRVFAHELAHNLGLPDLYDYDDKLKEWTYYTPNDYNDHPLVDWCLMGYYGYGYLSLGSRIPSHPCGWSKMQLGYIEPISIEGEISDLVIYDIETHDDSSLYKLTIDDFAREYFLLEYRNPQSTGRFDKFDSDFSVYFWPDLAYGADSLDRGLLITHIFDSLTSSSNWYTLNSCTPRYEHYTVMVEDAGYNPGCNVYCNPEGHETDSAQWWFPFETRKGALFSDDVDGQSEFGPQTYPSSDGYNGYSGIYVRVDSIVGDRMYLYVNTLIPLVHCCEVRGDINHDGLMDPLDVTFFVNFLWKYGEAPPCEEEADANGDTAMDPLDLIYLVDFFWKGGPAPVVCP